MRTRAISIILAASMALCLCGCASQQTATGTTESVSAENASENASEYASEYTVPYEFLTKEECADTLGGLDDYYAGLSQKSLDFFTQKKGATVEEYIEYSKEQARDYTDEEKAVIDECVEFVEKRLQESGMKLPENVSVSFATTTMKEASGAGGYTHGTTVFLNHDLIEEYVADGDKDRTLLRVLVAHEIFHCLTRNNPEFRKDMYGIINFTVNDTDFDIPEDVHAQMISNPDVGHHDSYATFTVNGEKKDCYLVFLSRENFEKPGDSIFKSMYTGLVDISDGTLYDSAEASDFYDVMGENTTYCEDPEECMATNFSYAVVHGIDGPNGEGYKTPSIIEDIIFYMQTGTYANRDCAARIRMNLMIWNWGRTRETALRA